MLFSLSLLKIIIFFLYSFIAIIIMDIIFLPLLIQKIFSLILVFFLLSFCLLLNGLEFLSLVILLLYIGAIAILFLFVVIILNPDFLKVLQQQKALLLFLQQRQQRFLQLWDKNNEVNTTFNRGHNVTVVNHGLYRYYSYFFWIIVIGLLGGGFIVSTFVLPFNFYFFQSAINKALQLCAIDQIEIAIIMPTFFVNCQELVTAPWLSWQLYYHPVWLEQHEVVNLGLLLYTKYAVALIVIGSLLLVSIIGVIILTLRQTSLLKRQAIGVQLEVGSQRILMRTMMLKNFWIELQRKFDVNLMIWSFALLLTRAFGHKSYNWWCNLMDLIGGGVWKPLVTRIIFLSSILSNIWKNKELRYLCLLFLIYLLLMVAYNNHLHIDLLNYLVLLQEAFFSWIHKVIRSFLSFLYRLMIACVLFWAIILSTIFKGLVNSGEFFELCDLFFSWLSGLYKESSEALLSVVSSIHNNLWWIIIILLILALMISHSIYSLYLSVKEDATAFYELLPDLCELVYKIYKNPADLLKYFYSGGFFDLEAFQLFLIGVLMLLIVTVLLLTLLVYLLFIFVRFLQASFKK